MPPCSNLGNSVPSQLKNPPPAPAAPATPPTALPAAPVALAPATAAANAVPAVVTSPAKVVPAAVTVVPNSAPVAAEDAPPNKVPEKNFPIKLEPMSVPLNALISPFVTFLISGSSSTL
jgi:hypothetical protein